MNYISYFNKICRICWMNIHIQSLKVWRKFVLPWLKCNIFARGLFFIGAPCICPTLHDAALRLMCLMQCKY